MKSYIEYILILILGFCIGCASVNFSKCTVKHPIPNDRITIDRAKILHRGKLIAELRFYFTAKLSENSGETYLFSSETQHRGLAIYYQNENEIVWIFPEDGRQEDVERGHFSARDQSDGYVGWVFDIRISDDGKFIYYKTPGLFSQSSFVFSVEHGVSKLIDRNWHL